MSAERNNARLRRAQAERHQRIAGPTPHPYTQPSVKELARAHEQHEETDTYTTRTEE